MPILKKFKARAKSLDATIVLPESYEERTLTAAAKIIADRLCKVLLVGEENVIREKAGKLGLDISAAEIINPVSYAKTEEFAQYLYQKRKEKGLSYEEALLTIHRPLFFGACLVKFGIASGMVAGAENTTADVLKAALQVVGVTPGLKTVSSTFIMVIPDFKGEDALFFFADSAVVPNPSAEQLADIAMSTAKTRKAIVGDEPKVALLSFSTKGSAKHELVDKVTEALAILTDRKVDFDFDGELQLDAAIIPEIAAMKAPDSKVAGHANTLIFPDLQAGNIGYKLVQRFAKAKAIGPIIQGLAAPICDLSRGCSIDDIVNTTVLVILMSAQE
ncbi:MAG: phosphate acetyltransferase [Candidatus Cloacimonadaceae bacterium]|nr:phosphate acetyltransferase [Candidatus Cloacimonadaceae bacterium]